ncbi:hypothetical protein AXK11_02810 [Cephaloticoccus primus]|uniref:TonB-dependent receptor n=1 Tax=Cephaloticoccus primus TaxID=1548207 RepID=A0A139SRF9_9BACT|nr:TonB-dependent receptor [Cephaloticoccus primus]KXU37123.1 hypothetical protein AXK11_02810 [Cephaloticoccus primus]
MRKYAFATRTSASALMFALCLPAFAQQSQSQTDEEIVHLSPFAVNESANMGRYQAAESTSGSRVRMDLMDSTQSISVVTNEFMSDIGTARLLDATKYVAGISSMGGFQLLMDVMNVRGFSDYDLTIDGFSQFSLSNQDPIIVERIEIVKGPNAILAPQGLPGGVVNNITKTPLFVNKGYASYQVGRWDANRAELDANYVLRPDKLALRVVGAFTDADHYGQGQFHQNTTVMPMFTYRLSPQTEFILQFQASNASIFAGGDIPVSVYAVGRSDVRPQDGLPRDFQIGGRNITAHQKAHNTRFKLSSQITDKLSMRVAGNWVESDVRSNFLGPSDPYLGQTGIVVDPIKLDQITGEWYWDGVTVNPNPTYILGGLKEWPLRLSGNFQNDFVYEHTANTWKSQTVAGYAFGYRSQHFRQINYIPDGIYYDFVNNYTQPAYTLGNDWNFNSSDRYRTNQAYIYEVLHLFENRLVLSGSISQNRYVSNTHNNQTGIRVEEKAEATLPSAGIVYKIIPELSVFYGFSKQEVLGSADPGSAIPPHTRPGRQHEGGLRLRLFEGRLYATVSYFDILQENLWEQDPDNYKAPIPFPLNPAVSTDRTSKGVEFEIAWSPTPNFSLIGSFTDFKFRDEDNIRAPNVAEETAALWASYTFSEGPLRGLRLGIGANYVGERAGDTRGRWTTPPLGYDPVRIQPRFWTPSYTIVEASASYRFKKHWHAQLNIHNLLDRDYVSGSGRSQIYMSTPINPKFTLRYDF